MRRPAQRQQAQLRCLLYGARRAARTALGLLQDLKDFAERLHRQHKLVLNPWIGLHTGPAIVEAKDATGEVKDIREINAGLYVFEVPALLGVLGKLALPWTVGTPDVPVKSAA